MCMLCVCIVGGGGGGGGCWWVDGLISLPNIFEKMVLWDPPVSMNRKRRMSIRPFSWLSISIKLCLL